MLVTTDRYCTSKSTLYLLHSILLTLTFKDSKTGLVQLEVGNNDLGGRDTNRSSGTVNLLARDTVNVDDPLLTVDLDDLTFATLVGTTNDHDFVILADGDRTNAVLLTEFLGQRSTHNLTTNIGGSGEMSLSALTARRTDV
jgi:hypothetical protein